jgi:hypothetical protein
MELDNGFQVLGPAANVSTALTLLRRSGRTPPSLTSTSQENGSPRSVAEVLRTMIVPFILTSAYC